MSSSIIFNSLLVVKMLSSDTVHWIAPLLYLKKKKIQVSTKVYSKERE